MRDYIVVSNDISFTCPNNSSFNLVTNSVGDFVLNFSSLSGSNVYEITVWVNGQSIYGLFLVYLFNGTTLNVLLSGGTGVGSSISGLNLTITTTAGSGIAVYVSINKF